MLRSALWKGCQERRKAAAGPGSFRSVWFHAWVGTCSKHHLQHGWKVCYSVMVMAYGHGARHRTIGTARIPLFGLQLFFRQSHSFSVASIFSPPTPLCVNRHGSDFALGLQMLLQASIWAIPGVEISQPLELVQIQKRIGYRLRLKCMSKARICESHFPTSRALA